MNVKIFKHQVPVSLALLVLAEALLFFAAPYLAAWFLDRPLAWDREQGDAMPWQALMFALATLVGMLAVGLYNPRQRFDLAGQLTRVLAAVAGSILLLAVLFFLVPDLAFSRGALLTSALIAVVGSMLIRLAFKQVVELDRFKRRILVFAASIAGLRRRSDQRGFVVVGYVRSGSESSLLVPEERVLRPEGTLCDLCHEQLIDEVVVAMDDRRERFPIGDLLECRLDGIEVTDLVTFLERETGKVKLDVLNPSWFIFSEGFRRGRVHASMERMFDIVASLALLAVAWPVMLLTILAIKLEDGAGASVLYGQLRVGQFGKPFRLLKFRSMVEDAERDGRARWAEPNDSRTTRCGAIIRKLRIDELPQIFNVLKGDMSFVGPRPERPEFVVELEQKIPFYRERHNLKPGITGWAQLCFPYGSSDADALEKLQYDLYYVKNHTLLFYLVVLVQTVEVVIWGKGAR
jgi:sugar transferase (PEP-CTERM system associated)